MHHYPHNIGDYRKDTSHLSLLEHGIYRQLLDTYYLEEVPLSNDLAKLMRSHSIRTNDEQQALQNVLTDFFSLTEEGYIHHRCDKELAHIYGKSESARASANARWSRKHKESDANAMPTQCEHDANGMLPNTQDPIPNTQLKPSLGETKFPPCPYDSLLLLWKKHLPHLTQPRTWEGSRQANMKSRWIQASKPSQYSPDGYKTKEDGIEWWDGFFSYIATDTKLAEGFESKDRSWKPDLQWILLPANFQKIIDGNYNK